MIPSDQIFRNNSENIAVSTDTGITFLSEVLKETESDQEWTGPFDRIAYYAISCLGWAFVLRRHRFL